MGSENATISFQNVACPSNTYLLHGDLLEELTGLQLVKKFPAFHGTRRFITALTSLRQLYILDQPNPVHIPTSHLLEIHPNIIHPSTPRSPQWSLSLRFPHQNPIRSPVLTQPISFLSQISNLQARFSWNLRSSVNRICSLCGFCFKPRKNKE